VYKGICEAIQQELEELEAKLAGGARMSSQDLEHIDKMAHALKSLAAYEEMQGSSERYEGTSGVRGRSRMTGRYVSREEGPRYSEGDGYNRRYY